METIKDRLVRIISSEGLTSAAFADTIGVQRSSISHILSGRNKPSLDFLQKIVTKFGKYNAEWLINGTGNIYKQPKQSNIFDNPDVVDSNDNESLPNKVAESKPINIPEPEKDIIPKSQDTKQIIPDILSKEKKIKRIIVIYNDDTFKDYKPTNQ